MDRLIAIGEALIDFIPHQIGLPIKDVQDFKAVVGGAPANVCAAFAKLGGKAALITQLGNDAFGDKILKELARIGIGANMISRTSEANTSLAFVSLVKNGHRDFSFYRNPAADMLLSAEQIKPTFFCDAYALHFCSVSLGNYPMKEAHRAAINMALNQGAIISFDPNVRLPLWNDPESLLRTIREFIPFAHILKISDEELEFITGFDTVEQAKEILFCGNVKVVLLTKGANGAEAHTRTSQAIVTSHDIHAIDSTGAGDAFIGSFLYQLNRDKIDCKMLGTLNEKVLAKLLQYSNEYCEYSIQRNGATASYATREEFEKYRLWYSE